jgi:hypothetical protein
MLNTFLTTTHIDNPADPDSGKLYTDLSSIVAGGKVGIGTSTPSTLLHVKSADGEFQTDGSYLQLNSQVTNGKTNLVLYSGKQGDTYNTNSYSVISFAKYNRPGQNATWSIMDTNFGLQNGNDDLSIVAHPMNSTSPAQVMVWTPQGNVFVAGTVSQSSDERLKENITEVENSLDKITKLRGVSYSMKEDKAKQTHLGVIAQEVQTQFPDLVNTKGEYLSVNYAGFVAPFIECIKELKSEIDALKTEINTLKQKPKDSE